MLDTTGNMHSDVTPQGVRLMAWRHAGMLGMAVALIATTILFVTVGDVGITWDEPIYIETAHRAIRWLGLILQGDWQQALDPITFGVSWGLNHEHPPLMRVVWGLGWALTRDILSPPLTDRVGALVFSGMGLGAVAALVARERGPRVALFTIAAILSMPRAFFHAHVTALDFPSAIMWMLTSLVFYRVMKTPPYRRTIWTLLRRSLILGVLLGLALLTKINAVLLMPFWALWLLWHRRLWRNAVMWLLSLPVALTTLVLGWPWLWKNTLGGLWAWGEFFRVHYGIPQWFAGKLYVDNTPWWAPVTIVLITTPVILLVLAGLAAWRRRHAQGALAWWLDLQFVGMMVVLVFFAMPGTHLHDSDRMLLPASFHLAILSGEGFQSFWRRFREMPPFSRGRLYQRFTAVVLAVGLLLPGGLGIVRLHPFELAYYNALVGGVRGAHRLGFETIYFAATYGYFLPELNDLPANTRVWVMPNSYDVLYYYQLNGLLRSDLVLLRPPGWGSFYDDDNVPRAEGWIDQADVALIERRQTAFNAALPNHARILYWAEHYPELARLERAGVTLASLHARP